MKTVRSIMSPQSHPLARGTCLCLLITAAWARAAQAQPAPSPRLRWVTDSPAQLVTQQEVPDSAWSFVEMPPGWHVTTGPGAILYDPEHAARGRFDVEAEMFLFPEASDAGYGIFIGGDGLDTEDRTYLSFVIRRDGSAAVLQVRGSESVTLVPWSRNEAVLPHGGTGTVRNTLTIEVGATEIVFSANGTAIARLPREAAPVDGAFGFRIGAGINLHMTSLDVTQRLAPPGG